MRVAPRKARPFVPEDEGSFDSAEQTQWPTLTEQPISLAQAKRLAADYDTVLLRATRDADLETPIGAFLALDDGTPAYLLESVEGGERLGRYSFLGILPRRLLEVRDGKAITRSRPVGVEHATELDGRDDAGHGSARGPAPLHAAAHASRRCPTCRASLAARSASLAYDAVSAFEPTVPLPPADPVGDPAGGLPGDGPGHRHRPPDPHAVRDRRAAHRTRPTSTRATRSPSAGCSTRSNGPRAPLCRQSAPNGIATAPAPAHQCQRNLDRDDYIAAVETRQGGNRGGEVIQVVRRPAPERRRGSNQRHRPVPRAAAGQPQPVPVLRAHARFRGRGRQPGTPPPRRGRPAAHPPHCRHAAARRNGRRRR